MQNKNKSKYYMFYVVVYKIEAIPCSAFLFQIINKRD